jgi:asparagine synthase (glutamine-hydrolysing)
MCGIVGFVGPYSRERLGQMLGRIVHRGPDEGGCHCAPLRAAGAATPDGSPLGSGAPAVGLGIRRLSIIGLADGQQPIWNEDRTLGVVFNGEIYNYRALRAELERAGHRFRTHADTEVIVHGFEVWGPGVLDRLDGMFAFALWDARAETLFLARDRFGIKPLYYTCPGPGQIVFGSEVKALLPFLPERAIHRPALYEFLLYGWSALPETIFRGVSQLPPAHTLTWQAGQLPKLARYWRLERQGRTLSPGQWEEALVVGLDAAVRSHLVADVPVGIALSGGLDSSAVLSLMAEQIGPERVQAVSVGFGLPNDELPYARIAAQHVGVTPREEIAPADTAARALTRMIWHVEEPIAHPVMATTDVMARAAGRTLKVAMVGEGADELFCGYPHYRLLDLPFRLAPRPLLQRMLLASAFLMPGPKRLAGLLAPAWRDRAELEAAAHRYDGYFHGVPLAEGMQRLEIETALPANQLLRVDKLTMAHSVEARVPFLDHHFAELAFDVPFALGRQEGQEKAVLRRAFARRLPSAILRRPKSGRRGTQALLPTLAGGVLRERIAEAMRPDRVRSLGIFEPEQLAGYFAQMRSPLVRRHPIESRQRWKFAYFLAVFDEWARVFLEGQGIDDREPAGQRRAHED